MADDKATIEAINNIAAMFPVIDKETITDIYLGCNKDLDQTIDQLIGMGAEQEVKKPAPVPTPVPTPVAPKVEEQIIPPSVSTLEEATLLTDSPAEKARLEHLNQQLSMEYRRLADTQERNMALEKQLNAKKESIAAEQLRLAEERKKLEEQQSTFLADKKRLEDHLSARLREMKEQMRMHEELNKVQEEEGRARAELARAEERKVADQARQVEKEAKREAKIKAKAERRALKEQVKKSEEEAVREMQEEYEHRIQEGEQVIARLRESLSRVESDLDSLRYAYDVSKAQAESKQQQTSVANLQAVVGWLAKATEGLQTNDNLTPNNIRQVLLESLKNTL